MEVVNIRAQQPLLVGSAGTSIQSMDEEYLIEEN